MQVHACMHACIHTYIRTCVHAYIRTYNHTHIQTGIPTYYMLLHVEVIHTHTHTHAHAHARTCIHTYIHVTYIHSMHACRQMCTCVRACVQGHVVMVTYLLLGVCVCVCVCVLRLSLCSCARGYERTGLEWCSLNF